jgi:hypothetical protein
MAPLTGWQRLLADADWCHGEGSYPIPAYSEFMPPPRLGIKPYGALDHATCPPNDNWGWNITEYQEIYQLRPGLRLILREVLREFVKLGKGLPGQQIKRRLLAENPYWPSDLAAHAGKLDHERYVVLLSLALARTQDDKGRIRWTLFGGSEQGPARPFWEGFWTAPRQPIPAEQGLAFFRRLLVEAHAVPEHVAADPVGAGVRVLPVGHDDRFPFWAEERFPPWCDELLWDGRGGAKRVKFLLTFRPFERLPATVREAYVNGELHLWPFPGSLVFWGSPGYLELAEALPFAMQIPLLHLFPRHNDPHRIRIPQSGWLHERIAPPAAHQAHGPLRLTYQRTHRWQAAHRDEDETVLFEECDKLTRVLFSTDSDVLGLYGKPMARNIQLWDDHYRLLLDGPRHGRAEIAKAVKALEKGGQFGYRFLWPPMQVGPYAVYLQRPLVAFPGAGGTEPVIVDEGPVGWLTAYRAERPDLAEPISLWPRVLDRPLHREAVELFAQEHKPRRHVSAVNVRTLLDFREMLKLEKLPRSLADALLISPKQMTPAEWLASLPGRSSDPDRTRRLAAEVEERLALEDPPPGKGLTFKATANRRFEVAYWKTIADLAHGAFRNKDNADCVRDEHTLAKLHQEERHHHRDLEALGEYLMRYHAGAIQKASLGGEAWVGEFPFHWQTDFKFGWSDSWVRNQDGRCYERDIVARIPGRDPSRAVIMADHYDTAYMADVYEPRYGGTFARVAAAGADDNHSATAALMLAAPIFLELSKAGKLACDVWLVHLTGEEFPADCLGARHLTQALVEGCLRVREHGWGERDLSGVRVQGVYVSDMIAHNNDRCRDVFQIAPGTGAASAWLALQAHLANEAWNALAQARNRRLPRKGRRRGRRVARGIEPPPLAQHAVLRGEVRPVWDPRSTLYNTDGQIFSDAGVPVVLFMENYDIDRSGYHDTHDTLANIDLDYGAALAAIVIESVARAATETPP